MRDAAIDTHRSPARGPGRPRAGGAPLLDDMAGENPVGRAAPRPGTITSAAIAARRLGGGRAGGRGERAPGLAARLRSRIPRVRPLKVVTVAAFGAALVGIVANAMVFQRGHHPSPLFGLGRSVDGAADAGAKTAAAVPPPAPATPVERTGTIPPAPASPVDPAPAATAALPKPAPVHRMPAKPHREEAATAKPADRSAAAGDHPRPGRVPAHAKPEAKADTLAKPLADPAHGAKAAKPDAKAAASKKPAAAQDKAAPHVKADPEPASRPHPRAASAAPAKPAAGAE